ncbi:hypothetical protein HK405_000782, partial [Cladochytrium tenue]
MAGAPVASTNSTFSSSSSSSSAPASSAPPSISGLSNGFAAIAVAPPVGHRPHADPPAAAADGQRREELVRIIAQTLGDLGY